MPNVKVATDARHLLFRFPIGQQIDGMYDIRMAVTARLLGDLAIVIRNLNGVWVIAGGEGQRMEKAISSLAIPLADKAVVRRVAVVANGHIAVRRLQPGVVLILHDVAIGTRFGIAGEIRRPLRIVKRIRSNSPRTSHQRRNADPRQGPHRERHPQDFPLLHTILWFPSPRRSLLTQVPFAHAIRIPPPPSQTSSLEESLTHYTLAMPPLPDPFITRKEQFVTRSSWLVCLA